MSIFPFEPELDREAIARIPRDLRNERGWSGAKIVGAVKLIEERLRKALGVERIDPDLSEARLIAHRFADDDFHADCVESGISDDAPAVQSVLAGIKRGRELERAAFEQAA